MESITLKEKSYTGATLEKDMHKMLSRIKMTSVQIRLNFKGAYYHLEEKVYDIIGRVCQELVTNSLKHANAKEIFISINIRQENINILVMDNGIGCHDLVLGNGLTGIKERLALINGKAEFITSNDEGFISKISIKK